MRATRLVSLLLLLQLRGQLTAAELAAHFGVSIRTIHRDVESLGAAGVPVEALRGPAGGYRLIRWLPDEAHRAHGRRGGGAVRRARAGGRARPRRCAHERPSEGPVPRCRRTCRSRAEPRGAVLPSGHPRLVPRRGHRPAPADDRSGDLAGPAAERALPGGKPGRAAHARSARPRAQGRCAGTSSHGARRRPARYGREDPATAAGMRPSSASRASSPSSPSAGSAGLRAAGARRARASYWDDWSTAASRRHARKGPEGEDPRRPKLVCRYPPQVSLTARTALQTSASKPPRACELLLFGSPYGLYGTSRRGSSAASQPARSRPTPRPTPATRRSALDRPERVGGLAPAAARTSTSPSIPPAQLRPA